MPTTKNNMKLWDAVCTTNPENTKHVNQRGGFTAIDAQSQFQSATEQFGAFGIGWGVKDANISPILQDKVLIYTAILWYKYGGESGEFPIETSIQIATDRVDGDAVKKLSTDAITKGLSRLGFNADVFLGKFDDNRYTEEKPSSQSSGDFSNNPDDSQIIWFGKNQHKRWDSNEVDEGYLNWVSQNMDGKPKRLADDELTRRSGGAADAIMKEFEGENIPF